MSAKNTQTFDELFKEFNEAMAAAGQQIADALVEGAEQARLAMQCQMCRFFLVRSEDTDPDKTSGTGIIAEGVVFEDGTVAMRWRTKHVSTALYASVADVEAIHGHNGKTVVKYIDAAKATQ